MSEVFKETLGIETASRQSGVLLKNIKDETAKLKQWLSSQRHLPNAANDSLLEKFILSSKGNLEKAQERLDAYFTVRNLVPHYFSNRDPLDTLILACNQYLYAGLLPGLSVDGCRVVIVRLKHGDPGQYCIDGVARRCFNMLDVWLSTDPHANRVYFIADCTHAKKAHIFKNPPRRIRDIVYCIQNVYPIGIEALIFIKVAPVIKVLIEKGLKPLTSRKISKKISVYSEDFSDIYRNIPLSMMPTEYGGDGPSLEELNESWINYVNGHRDWLITSGTLKSEETLRDGKCSISGVGCSIM